MKVGDVMVCPTVGQVISILSLYREACSWRDMAHVRAENRNGVCFVITQSELLNTYLPALRFFPKTCTKCEKVYSASGWFKLPLLARRQHDVDDGGPSIDLEQRNCPCGGTMAIDWNWIPEKEEGES